MSSYDVYPQLNQYKDSSSSSSLSRPSRFQPSDYDRGYSSSSGGKYNDKYKSRTNDYPSSSSSSSHYSNNRDSRYKPYNRTNYKQDKQLQYERTLNRYQHDSPYCTLDAFLEADTSLEKKLFNKESSVINFENTTVLDIKTTGSNVPMSLNTFNDCDFHEIIKNNIKLSQYEKPTPVQQHALPIILAKRDLMACAQTGSGKTAAFLIPILNSIYSSREQIESYKIVNGVKRWQPLVLILAPTRELALQIYDEAKKFAYRSCLRSFVVYGGADIKTQMRNLDVNGCHVLVATPGRLIDLYNKEIISFENIKYLVLDEADRMLDMGFEPQIREIVQQKNMPNPSNRQTLLFSATFPKQIQLLAKDFLNNYIFLAVGRVGSTNSNITQRIIYTTDNDKHSYLVDILDRNPQTLTLIFVETRRSCDELEKYLQSKRFSAISIHGKKSQSERERALQLFRSGSKLILVATAVAARGLDISNVKIVVNFDVPNDIDDYVHRIGRTGRAGSNGEAISFFNDKNRPVANELCSLLQEAQQEIPEFLQRMAESRGFKRGSNYQNSYKRPSNDQHQHNNSNSYSKQENSYSSYRPNSRFSNGNENHSNGSYASYDQQKQQNGYHQYQTHNNGSKLDSINGGNNGTHAAAATNYSMDPSFANNAYLAFLLPQLPPPPPPPEY